MKNKILLIIILFILIILTIYFYIYKIKENFLNKTNYTFIGFDISNKLKFYNKLDNNYYHPIDSEYYKKQKADIINFLYHNKMLIVLDTSNNISYCTECDLTKEYSFTPINNNFTIPIKNIAFDQEVGNNLFILLNDNNFSLLKNFNTNLSTIIIPMPKNSAEDYFIDFDAKYGRLVGIGNKTNFIYQIDINRTNLDNNFTDVNWNILDKNQSLINIKITWYGYVGQDRYNVSKFYLCNKYNNYKWTEMNIPRKLNILSIEGTSIEGISFLIQSGSYKFLYIYDEYANKLIQITTIDDISNKNGENNLNKMKVIDYIYPPLATVPELNPLDTASMVASSDNIKKSNENYQKMIQLLNDIDINIKSYYTNQLKFNNDELNKKINDRNQKVIQFKKDIGMKEPFVDINIDFKKINQKLKPPPVIFIDKEKVMKPKGEDLIINYP